MLKKKIAFALAGLMTVSALPAAVFADEEVTEITWWSSDTGAKMFWDEKVEEFNDTIGKENGIKLVTDYTMDRTATEIAIQNGEGPDILGVGDIRKRVEAGWYASLDDIPQLAELVENNDDVRVEGTNVVDGKLYCLPVATRVYGLAYNKDMFVEAGIVDENGEAKPPVTYDEMLEDARLLTDAKEQKFGLILPLKWGGWAGCEIAPNGMAQNGYGFFNPVTGEWDLSGMLPVIDMVMTMKDEGLLYPGADGLDNDPARARFAEGNVGMKFCVSWDIGVWNDQFPAKCDWGVAPLPVADAENAYKQKIEASFSFGINKASAEDPERLEKVATVFNWMYSDEMQIDAYEQGFYIPFRSDIVEAADPDNMTKAGLADFGKIVAVSGLSPDGLPLDTNGKDGWETTLLTEVWSGQKTSAEWMEEVNALYNEAVEYYKEIHPDEDYSIYENRVNPDWVPEER